MRFNGLLLNNLGSEGIEINGDSQLVVKQLNDDYKVKAKRIMPLFKRVMILKSKLKDVHFHWIAREQNKEADVLTNKVYNKALRDNPEFFDRVLGRGLG
jgi:ribonuclease HI